MVLKSLIEQLSRVSGRPASAGDVQNGLEENGVDLTQYVGVGGSILPTIQRDLEALASEKKVIKRVSPGGGTSFQWINPSDPAPGSFASSLGS